MSEYNFVFNYSCLLLGFTFITNETYTKQMLQQITDLFISNFRDMLLWLLWPTARFGHKLHKCQSNLIVHSSCFLPHHFSMPFRVSKIILNAKYYNNYYTQQQQEKRKTQNFHHFDVNATFMCWNHSFCLFCFLKFVVIFVKTIGAP